MAGTGRINAIASLAALCLFWGMGASAATIMTGPGTPETLIRDARLTVSSSRAVGRSVPPPPVRRGLVGMATVAAARTGCLVASTSAANSVAPGVGYLWTVTRCLGPKAAPEPAGETLDIASLYLPPPPAPFWPAGGVPVRIPLAGGGIGGPGTNLAPVPAPAAGLALPAALGALVALRRRRRR